MIPRLMLRFACAAVLCGLPSTMPLRADFITPPWTRGDADTTYQQWDVFTDPVGTNAPDVADDNPSGSSSLLNTETTAFLTGGGNIYSFSAPLDINVTVPNFDLGAGYLTTIILQVRSLGTEIDPSSVELTAMGGSAVGFDTSMELARSDLGGFGGSQVDTLYRWDVLGNASSYLLEFTGLGSSLSLDSLSVDTQVVQATAAAVPEPASLALTAAGLGALAVIRFKRRRSSPAGRRRV